MPLRCFAILKETDYDLFLTVMNLCNLSHVCLFLRETVCSVGVSVTDFYNV